MSTGFSMIKLQVFTNRKASWRSCIKFLQRSPYSLVVLGYMVWLLSWQCSRTKEVGIRKVHGATAGNIVYLFSREFIILIAVAFAIATPIAWYYMQNWLQGYVYRISISWWIFAAGGSAALLIALTTISLKAVKAALANPAKSLRSE